MPRKGHTQKRDVLADPIYNNKVVTKLINNIMLDGKRGVAQKIVYGAFDRVAAKTERPAIEVFEEAMNNIMPVLEVKARRIGGATYQVPIEVKPDRRQALALRWMTTFSRARGEKTMEERLANEILDAANNTGASVKKKETPKKSKLDIETRKKIVGDGVKKILDMSDEELISRYDGKSEDEVQEMLYEEPWCENEYFDDDLLAFLSVLTCMSIDFEDAFINWLAHFIFRRLIDIHKKVMVESPKIQSKKTVKTTPPKVQSPKIRKVNQGGAPRTKSPKICSEHVSQSSRNVNQARASVAIKQEETSNGKGGIIFLIIIGLLFGYGYISLKKEEAEWDMAQEQYRIESRRKAEQNEFKVREEKRKKKEGQSSNSSSSSSSSSYDEGSDDAYSGDYDENRYDNDENYRDGVDDMLDELGE